jgi:hypothetical protein
MTTTQPTNDASAPITPDSSRTLGDPTLCNMVQVLWERTANSLSKKELEWFAGFSEQAGYFVRDLAAVTEGIAYLVEFDPEGCNTGIFQNNHSVFQLLRHISVSTNALGAMIEVGDLATDRLLNSEYYRKLAEDKSRE